MKAFIAPVSVYTGNSLLYQYTGGVPHLILDFQGLKVEGIQVGPDNFFLGPAENSPSTWPRGTLALQETPGLFSAKLMKVYFQERTNTYYVAVPGKFGHSRKTVVRKEYDNYIIGSGEDFYQLDHPNRLPYIYADFQVTLPDGSTHDVTFKYTAPLQGRVTFEPEGVFVTTTCAGHSFKYQMLLKTFPWDHPLYNYNYDQEEHFRTHLRYSDIDGGPDALWAAYLQSRHDDSQTPLDGVKALYKKPCVQQLQENPFEWTFFRWLHDKRSNAKVTNNQYLKEMLTQVDDYHTLVKALRQAREAFAQYSEPYFREDIKRFLCQNLPGAKNVIPPQKGKDAKDLRDPVSQLGISETQHPLLRAAVLEEKIPMGIFNQPKGHAPQGQPVNREFDLWEKALKQKDWAPTIYAIAESASRRTTYERDISPYLMFLFRICAYLNRHAPRPKGWKAMPKFVQSQVELELTEIEEGTVKKRSALTPIADNDTGVVTVPYVALSVGGARTQWCYSQFFYIFEEGLIDPESKGVVTRDLEPQLNGKDDYGLCYYTLTGTYTARGYPTFLIIFEKRKNRKAPFVHFHRVHPSRSKDGVTTPACELIERCYQYMAGNIPASEVVAQQGDLIFLHSNPYETKDESLTGHTLTFESHAIQCTEPVTLHITDHKTIKNRLGFLHTTALFRVNHPEHDPLEEMQPGWYEIRRCKSWEANPKAIWSRTID